MRGAFLVLSRPVLHTLLVSAPPAARLLARPSWHPARGYRATRMQMQETDETFGFGASFAGGPPTDKQINFARRLAQQVGKPLSPDVLSDKQQISEWIDQALELAPPSDRQLEYARALADNNGIELPEDVTQNAKAVSTFIDRYKGTGTGGMGGVGMGAASGSSVPSDKQIIFAAQLARQNNVGIDAQALQDKASMSRFISELLPEGQGGAGGAQPGQFAPSISPMGGAAMGGAVSGFGFGGGDDDATGPSDRPAADGEGSEEDLFREPAGEAGDVKSFSDSDIPF